MTKRMRINEPQSYILPWPHQPRPPPAPPPAPHPPANAFDEASATMEAQDADAGGGYPLASPEDWELFLDPESKRFFWWRLDRGKEKWSWADPPEQPAGCIH